MNYGRPETRTQDTTLRQQWELVELIEVPSGRGQTPNGHGSKKASAKGMDGTLSMDGSPWGKETQPFGRTFFQHLGYSSNAKDDSLFLVSFSTNFFFYFLNSDFLSSAPPVTSLWLDLVVFSAVLIMPKFCL